MRPPQLYIFGVWMVASRGDTTEHLFTPRSLIRDRGRHPRRYCHKCDLTSLTPHQSLGCFYFSYSPCASGAAWDASGESFPYTERGLDGPLGAYAL